MTPSMKHHRTTRKKSRLRGLAPLGSRFSDTTWSSVDRATRRAAWSRLRSARESRSRQVQGAGLAGAILVLVLGAMLSLSSSSHVFERTLAQQSDPAVQQTSIQLPPQQAAADVRVSLDAETVDAEDV